MTDKITYYRELVQGSDEWLKARLGIITASNMAKLITPTGKLADNEDSRDIVFQILSERMTGIPEETPYNFDMERGNTFEPFARDLYSDSRNRVVECGFVVREFDGFKIGYSPDGLVGDDGLIEIKCPRQSKHVKEMVENKEPKSAMMQIQTGLLVTGRKYCDFLSFYNGMEMRIVPVLPNEELHGLIIQAAQNLEKRVQECLEIYKTNAIGMPKAKYIKGI